MNNFKFLRNSTFVVTAAISAATPALAEESRALEEIVVTATKRAESIQDVPVSVSTLDGESMKALGVTDMGQITEYIPNFEFSAVGILPNLYIRGIGSGTTHSIEQSVGRFVDDVYIGRAAINLHSFMDVASVEVLRGPQGTLFGKNTLGGAMIVHTGAPTEEFSMGIDASVNDYSTIGGGVLLNGFVSGALSNDVRARLAFMSKDSDGYVENNLNGPDGEDIQELGARLKLEWDASDLTTIGLKLEYMDYQSEGQTFSETTGVAYAGGPLAGQPNPGFINFLRSFDPEFSYDKDWVGSYDCGTGDLPDCPDREQTSTNITLNVASEITGVGTLDFITAFQTYDYINHFNAPETGLIQPFGIVQATREEEYQGFSQEVRLTSEIFDDYDYIIGAFFESSSLARDQLTRFHQNQLAGQPAASDINGEQTPFFYSRREDWAQDTTSFAIFGQFKYNFTDSITGIVGGRWGVETKDFELEQAFAAFSSDPRLTTDVAYDDDRKENKFTPSLTLRWEQSEDVMLFATLSQGHKTGGFSDRPVDGVTVQDLEFESELNTNFEVGMKGMWLDGTLQANVAIYHMQIEDLQVARVLQGASGLEFELKNAAEATSQGIEVDTRWLVAENWVLGTNFAYTDATYDDFPDANDVCPTAGGSLVAGNCNYEGLPLIFAPEYKAGVYIEYSADDVFAGWSVRSRLDANYSDEFYVDINYRDAQRQESYTIVNANVRFTSSDGKYAVGLVGKNLTEEYVVAFGAQLGGIDFVAPKAPREIALQFSYNY